MATTSGLTIYSKVLLRDLVRLTKKSETLDKYVYRRSWAPPMCSHMGSHVPQRYI